MVFRVVCSSGEVYLMHSLLTEGGLEASSCTPVSCEGSYIRQQNRMFESCFLKHTQGVKATGCVGPF